MNRPLVVLIALLGACAPPTPQPAPPSAADLAARPWRRSYDAAKLYGSEMADEEPLGHDLGLAVGEVADSTIEQLLNYHVQLPDRVAIGVLHLPGARARRWWESTAGAELTQVLADTIAAAFAQTARVSRAVPLPGVLVAERPTVAALREGAARVQVHVLAVYRPSCRLFQRTPVVGVTQYRSECTIEATVLDTRSGVLPFTTIVTRDAITTRVREDFDVSGTERRVQRQALITGGVEMAARIGAYVSAAPVSGP